MKVFTLVCVKDKDVYVGVYNGDGVMQMWLDADYYIREGYRIGVNWQEVIEQPYED